jgi:hypothetical protein
LKVALTFKSSLNTRCPPFLSAREMDGDFIGLVFPAYSGAGGQWVMQSGADPGYLMCSGWPPGYTEQYPGFCVQDDSTSKNAELQ